MNEALPFADHYARLGLGYDFNSRALEVAYRACAKKFHPDTSETPDIDQLGAVVEAYRVLRDPAARRAYDALYFEITGIDPTAAPAEDSAPVAEGAVEDGEAHVEILRLLYRRRREFPAEPGLPIMALEDALACTPEQLEFHLWYLKAKQLIEFTEQGLWAITVGGVDFVIAASRSATGRQLFITDLRS